jgi:hypothetical protein
MNETGRPAERLEGPTRLHEAADMRVRPIALFGAGLFVFICAVLLAIGGVYRYASGPTARPERSPSPVTATPSTPAAPRLQVDPGRDLQEVRAAEETLLKSYGWVDRKAGIVRIPIDRAIELLVERAGSGEKA